MIEKDDAVKELFELKHSYEYVVFDSLINRSTDRPVVCALVGGLLRRWCKNHNVNFKEMCINMIIADVLANAEEGTE